MNWQTPPLLIPLAVTAAISTFLVFYIKNHRRDLPGAIPLMLLQGLVSLWTLGHMLSWASVDLDVKVFSSQIQYVASASTPFLWLIFILHYLDFKKYLSRAAMALVGVIPATTILLKWSNRFHHLIWQEYSLTYVGPYTRNNITGYGVWFWVHSSYSYLLMLLGTGLLLYEFFKSSGQRKKQTAFLLLGAAAPWIANFLYLTRTSPFEGLNLTPFALTFTGLAITWGLLRYQTSDVDSITRETIAGEILGLSKDNLIGKPIAKVMPQWAALGKSPRKELEFEKGGETYYYDVSISTLVNKRGRNLGQAIVMRDITARKLVEQEVAQALEEASKASRMKSRLIANVSHDLRSPMGDLIGYSEILQSGAYGEITEGQKAIITEILANGEELLNFINNLLGQSQLETGAFKPDPKPIPSEEVFPGIQSSARSLARAKGVDLITDIRPNMRQTIIGDRYWLNQIIINLISYAVKYTDEGHVKIWLEGVNEDFWSINVTDTGRGLPEDVQEQLREGQKPTHAKESHVSKTGIGLSIAQQIAALMGGTMNFRSAANQGSTFTVTLPYAGGKTVNHGVSSQRINYDKRNPHRAHH